MGPQGAEEGPGNGLERSRPYRQLSLGQKMRGELTAALLHEPAILYLDEPTIGLDVVSKARVRQFLGEVNRQRGVTILLTTHDLADVERLSTRVMVIDRGQLAFDGTIAALRSRHGRSRTLVVDLEQPRAPLQLDHGQVTRVEGPRQWIRFDREETTAAELIRAVAHEAPVLDVTVEEAQIEEVITELYNTATSPPPGSRRTGSCAQE